jgi:hypothetical protein
VRQKKKSRINEMTCEQVVSAARTVRSPRSSLDDTTKVMG